MPTTSRAWICCLAASAALACCRGCEGRGPSPTGAQTMPDADRGRVPAREPSSEPPAATAPQESPRAPDATTPGEPAAATVPTGPPRTVEATDEGKRIAITKDLAFVLRDYRLRVTDGRRSAPLSVCGGAAGLVSATVRRGAVSLRYEGGCCTDDPATFTIAGLAARLENAEALRHHRAKAYAAAAEGFARAAALDPTFDKAATNLACALALQGKRSEAVAALRSRLRDEPLATYAAIVGDTELASLLEAPEVQALRAPEAGTAAIRIDEVKRLFVAASADGRFVAASDQYQSWGSSHWSSELHVVERATGEERARLALVGASDADGESGRLTARGRDAVEKRLAAANRFLEDLGFGVPAGVEQVTPEDPTGGDFWKVRFPRTKTSLLVKEGAARVLRGGTLLGERAGLPSFYVLAEAALLPGPGAAVFRWAIDEPEGCGWPGDVVGVAVVPFTAPPEP